MKFGRGADQEIFFVEQRLQLTTKEKPPQIKYETLGDDSIGVHGHGDFAAVLYNGRDALNSGISSIMSCWWW